MTTSALPAHLTAAQQDVVHHYQSYSVPATWFYGAPDSTGAVEVIALGDGFIWSFRIDPDGEYASSEAEVGPFSTGINI